MGILKNAWLQFIIKTLVERIPVVKTILGWINGHKTQIGRSIMFITALLALVMKYFEAQLPWLANVNIYYTAIAGWLMTELGLEHKALKELENK